MRTQFFRANRWFQIPQLRNLGEGGNLTKGGLLLSLFFEKEKRASEKGHFRPKG